MVMDFFDLWAWPFMAFTFGAMIIIGIIILIFWIWMLIDCIKRNFRNDVEKILWIVIMIFASWIGAIVYYFAIRLYNPRGIAKK